MPYNPTYQRDRKAQPGIETVSRASSIKGWVLGIECSTVRRPSLLRFHSSLCTDGGVHVGGKAETLNIPLSPIYCRMTYVCVAA